MPELLELTAARGFAAFAVVLFHVDRYSGEPIEQWFQVSELGKLAVDFFFVLSGFVLVHVYGAAWAKGTYRHRDFLVRRIARIWPLHFVCLFGVGAVIAAGSFISLRPAWPVEASSFFAHLFLLNATGLSPQLSWNQPAWSVGAEWSAYLAFPFYLVLCSRLRSAWAKLAATITLLVGLWAIVSATSGLELLSLDANGGILRIIPSFFAGVALRQIYGRGVGAGLSGAVVTFGLAATSVAALTAIWLRAPAIWVWPALPALIYLLALRARISEPGLLRSRTLIWLGEVSYALYLVHALVLMVTFTVAKKIVGAEDPLALLALGALGAVLAICVAAVAHYAVERPAQRLILKYALAPRRSAAARLA